jgi:crossover junction endodeoxyribonuclease RuvC
MPRRAKESLIEDEVILGLDPGIANFGWAVYYTNEEVMESGVIKTIGTLQDHQRMLQIVEELDTIVRQHDITCVAIEQMLLHRSIPSIIKGYGARMCVLMHLTQRGILFEEYNPTSTKKVLLGKGVAEKNDMREAVIDWFLVPNKRISEHEVDSFAQIAMYLKGNKVNCPALCRMEAWTATHKYSWRKKECKK